MASFSQTFIEIDGSYLEGGGQILRLSTALSALLNKPIKINKIRAGRKDKGLKPQHLTGLQLLAQISQAKLIGDEIKSTEISFIPTKLNSGTYLADTKTAGSICLMIQNALPALIFTKEESKLHLRGGTNAEHSPPIDYFQSIFQPISKKFGIEFECEVHKRGYYPQGGGEVYLKTIPIKHLNPINITDFGNLNTIHGRAYVAGFLPIKIAQRMADTAKYELANLYPNITINVEAVKEREGTYIGTGTGIILIAETTSGCLLASSAVGSKGIPAESVAKQAVESLREDLDAEACVDQYMQDQLIIFMVLANGKSKIKSGPLTLHTKTAIHYSELLTGAKFNVNTTDNRSFIIECDGICFEQNEN